MAESGAPFAIAAWAADESDSTTRSSPAGSVASRWAATRCDRRALVREAARRRRVQARPLARRQIGLDCGPHDRVDEAQRSALLEDPCGGELVGGGGGGTGVQAGEAGGEPEVRLAQHGRRWCQFPSGRGQATQPLHDRVRDRARRKRRDAGRRLPQSARCPPPQIVADELVDEERNAASHLVAGRRESRLHVGPEPQPHKLGHRVHAQRRKYQDLGRRLGGERGKQQRTASRLGGPRRRDDRDRQFPQPSPQVMQKAQRGLVSPVHIVDAQQQRAAPPQVRAQPVEPVQDRERRVEQRFRSVILRRRDAEQRRRAPGRAGEELGPFRRRRRDERGLEQLADQAVGEVSLEF